MRRSRVVAMVVPLVVTAALAPVATAAPAAPVAGARPATWTNVTTPPMSGDTTEKMYQDVAIVPGAGVWATGYTRHSLPGVSEVRTLVERNTGAGWVAMDTPDVETAPAADYMYGVAGTAADDVWVVGRSAAGVRNPRSAPYAIHWDGTGWTRATVPDPSGGAGADMSEVVAVSRNNVWAVGTAYPLEAMGAAYHWDGTAWSSFRLPLLPGCKGTNYTELTALTATPSGEVYAGGDCPTKTGYAGFIIKMQSLTSWQVVARISGSSAIADMTSDADGTVWATGTRTGDNAQRPFLLYGSGTTWNLQFRPVQTGGNTEQAHGVAVTPTGITMIGEVNNRGQRAPWGMTWTPDRRWQRIVITAPESTSWMMAIAGSAGGPVWAMGEYLGSVGGKLKMVGFAAYPARP